MLSRAQQSLLKVDCILRDFRSNRDISLSQIIDFHFAKHISSLTAAVLQADAIIRGEPHANDAGNVKTGLELMHKILRRK